MIRSIVFVALVSTAFAAPAEEKEKTETVVIAAPHAAPYAFAAPYAAAGSPLLGAPLVPKISYEKAAVRTYQPVVTANVPEYNYKAVPFAVPTPYAAPYYTHPYAYGYPYYF